MAFEIVLGMPMQPYVCIHCGSNPTNDRGDSLKSIYTSGVDVGWGDSVYTCVECGNLIADLVGRVTVEGFEIVTERYEDLLKEYEELLEAHEAQQELVDKIREGAKARKALDAKPKSKPEPVTR